MLKGKMVRIRQRRYFPEQKLWAFVGNVTDFSENWVCLEGKGIVVVRGKSVPAEIDEAPRPLMIPRDNIANIRILPHDFDLDHIEICFEGIKVGIKVKGAPDTWISEVGEAT